MGLIVPGRNVRCISAVTCDCGLTSASEGSIYMCEVIGFGGIVHLIVCPRSSCDGTVIVVRGKECGLCSCCFGPIDDGDTSLVADEGENPYDTPVPTAPSEREKETA